MLRPCQVALGSPRPLGGACRVRPHLTGRVFSSLGFIKCKLKCLHRLVTPLMSKHGLIVGWSRGWGCQLYPQDGKEPCSSFPIPSISCPRGFALPSPPVCSHLRNPPQLCPKSAAFSLITAVPVWEQQCQPHWLNPTGFTSQENPLFTQSLLLHSRAAPRADLVPSGLGAAWKRGRCQWQEVPWGELGAPPHPKPVWDSVTNGQISPAALGSDPTVCPAPKGSSRARHGLSSQQLLAQGLPGQAELPVLPNGPC